MDDAGMATKTLPPSSRVVLRLVLTVLLLSPVAAGVGLFLQGAGEPHVFETLRGQMAYIHGRGLYRFDTLFAAAGARGTDAVTLVLGVPLLLVCALVYQRGSLRGALLLLGTLGYFLYVYAGYSLGTVAYNPLFLLYVVLFSASLYAFILVFSELHGRVAREPDQMDPAQLPRRGPGIFMLASGAVTLVVWSGPLIAALATGRTPDRLDIYATKVTEALDLALIAPAAFASGILILRRRALGYLIAMSLLVLEMMLAPLIGMQTVMQLRAGIVLLPGEIIGPLAGFVVLALLALWVAVTILRPLDAGTQRVGREG
jgi:hypothetical protein